MPESRGRAIFTLALRLALAAMVVIAAFFIRQELDQFYGISLPPFITFYPAIMVVALLFGLWPGIFATFLATFLTDYFILPPVGRLSIARASDVTALTLFFFICIFITLVCERSRGYEKRIAVFESEQKLRESRDLLRLFIEHALMSVAMFDRAMCYVAASRRWRDDYALGDRELTGVSHYAVFPEIGEAWKSTHRRGMAGETVTCDEDRFERADGSVQWLRWEVRPWFKWDGSVGGILIFSEDITEMKNSQDALRRSEARYRNLFETSLDGIAVTTLHDGRFVDANPAFLKMIGVERQELLGRTAAEMGIWAGEDERRRFVGCIRQSGGCQDFETPLRKRDGETRWTKLSASTIQIDGRPHIFTIARDITEARAAQEEIRRLAFFDPLTGLANRRLLLEQIHKSIAVSARTGHQRALLYVDLDNFKSLNDSRGHEVGDQLLREVARRLTGCVRESDTVGRLGGDEFIVLLEELSTDREDAAYNAQLVAEKVLEQIRRPCALAGRDWAGACSIGITVFGGRHEDVHELLRQADVAMYQAKTAGGDAFCLYDATFDAAAKML